MGKTKRDQKRRDKKGRILRNGESQRKDGRYAFVYTDCYGKQKFLYSWKLEPTDSLPVGRRPCQSLREKEKIVLREIEDCITPYGGNLTVLELVKKYIRQKTGVRHNTQANYNFVINIIAKEDFGQKRIDTIKLSDAKEWLIKLQADGRGYSSIHSIRGVVRPAFQMAVDDELLRKNPFEFQLSTVVVNDSVTREAITRKQERALLEFVKNDKHFSRYYEGIYILFKTGLRISEFVGLQKSDIDFESGIISVTKTLYYKSMNEYTFVDPKTSASIRTVVIDKDTIRELKDWMEVQKKVLKDCNFVLSYSGIPTSKHTLPRALEKLAGLAGVHRIKIHALRHSHVALLISMGVNPLIVKDRLGHEKIQTTLGTYGHLYPNSNFEVAKKLTGMLSYTPATHSIADYTSNQFTAEYHREVI